MRTLGDLIQSVSKVDIKNLIVDSFYESKGDYIRLQQEQMLSGIRVDSKPIFNVKTGKDTYSPSYAKYKGKSKPIDLYDTGAFQGDIFLHVDDATTFTVDSADSKSGKLQENYGTQIFGLDDDNKLKFKPFAQETLARNLKNQLSR